MRKAEFYQYIREYNFKELFIAEMGWNNFRGQAEIQPIRIEDNDYCMTTVAERNGFQIITCPVQVIPTITLCRKIDYKLRRYANDYICIFYIPDAEHQQWIAPVKLVEKRDIVIIEYESADKAEFLFSKMDDLSFNLDEVTTIVDVKERIQGAFVVNSEKITKDFYVGFKKEHKAFADFISGIDDHIETKANRNKQWYTSVMLNRLMFCYFIQKKGFLNGDVNYLQNKLMWVQKEKGENRFFQSFYKGFLSNLFHDGLNDPQHDRAFEDMYGRVPYLNGGMFEEHQLEHDYRDIDICDDAFSRLFNFFDTWRWHLDTRITASGKDINPDVLGYIFEQYINDRAQMGAYYTKEDITEYIGKNCIIPFLMDKVASGSSASVFQPDGYVWQSLRQSGDTYVYDAVKKGYSPDWATRIPQEIAVGIDITQPNLLERRSQWNTKTPEPFALPTEIWRETIERLQRCESVLGKIQNGEITHINDFITYNLDIRSFAYDLIRHTDDHLFVRHFYKALQGVTILDPTCGSGAFLFAAMNILEPLYEVCIERMQEYHAQSPVLFKPELEEISNKYRSNIQYFIFKSIILRNLYGVDIMVEATEIAKLRLFLKMMAVVEVDYHADNLGLDPLPDIDFNIRCGNTLVGYATEEELNRDLAQGDSFAAKEYREKIENMMIVVAKAYEIFKHVQLNQNEDLASFKQAKHNLKEKLRLLNELLNKHMYGSIITPYNIWLNSHQPFHWLAEFYQIIQGKGGFDVIIGNPPYVEYNKKDKQTGLAISDIYKINGYKTESCANLYAYVIERCKSLSNIGTLMGMIIPHSSVCTDRMKSLCDILKQKGGWLSFYDIRPSKLFDGVDQRLLIFISNKGLGIFTTKYNRWHSITRTILFNNLRYVKGYTLTNCSSISKISCDTELNILSKILPFQQLGLYLNRKGGTRVYYHNAPRYFLRFSDKPPYFYSDKKGEEVSIHIKNISASSADAYSILGMLNASIFYFWFITFSNCRDLVSREIDLFPIGINMLSDGKKENLTLLSKQLIRDFDNKSYRKECYYKSTGKVIYDEYYPKLSKPIIDEIDKVLARHYGFTDEELDFIINYDIKYRMGDELNDTEE